MGSGKQKTISLIAAIAFATTSVAWSAPEVCLRQLAALERKIPENRPEQRPSPVTISPLFDFSEVLSKTVVIFPSPSDAKPEMGRELYENYASARKIYLRAAQALGYEDVSRLFLKEEDRAKTEFYTICTVVYSIAMYELLSERMGRKIRPLAATGSSAGQVAAEIISGAISLEDGLRMLQSQSGIFSEAAKELDYAIFRVSGMDAEAIRPVLRFGEIEIVQDASPAFITIAVKRGVDFEELKNKIRKLDTTGKAKMLVFDPPLYKAPHSSFYDPYREEILKFINGMEVRDPELPVISILNGQMLTTASQLRKEIEDQFFRGVLWRGAINAAVSNGAVLFIELSPGDKLTRLNEYLAPNTPSAALTNPAESAKLNTALLRAYLGEAWYRDLAGFIADVTAGKISKPEAETLAGSISLEECEAAYGQLKRLYQYSRVDIDAFPAIQRNKILFLRAVANRMNKDSGVDLEDVGIGNTIFYNTETGKGQLQESGRLFSKTAGKTLESANKDLKRLCEIEAWRVLMSSPDNRKKLLDEITGKLPDFNRTLTAFFNDGRQHAATDISAVKGGTISSWKRGAICARIKVIADDATERTVYLKTGNVAVEEVIRRIYAVIAIPAARGIFKEGPLSYELLEDVGGRTLDKVPSPEKEAKKKILGYQMGRKLFSDMCFLIGEGNPRNNILDANDRVVRVDLDVALQKGLLASEINPLSRRFAERIFLTANRFFPDRKKLRQAIELFRPYFGNFASYLAETETGQDPIALEALLDGPVREGFFEASKTISGDLDKLMRIVEEAMSRGVATSPSLKAVEKDIPAHVKEWARMDPVSLEVFFNYVVKPAVVIHCLYFEALRAAPASRLRGDRVDEIYEYIDARYTRHEQAIAASGKRWSLNINSVINNVMPAFNGNISRECLEALIQGITEEEYNINYGELKARYEGSRFEITNFSEEKRETLVLLKILADKYDTVTGVDTGRVLAADTLFFNLPLEITKPKDLSAEFSQLADAGNKDFTRLILSTLWRIKEGRNTAAILEKNIDALCEGIGPSLVDVLGPGDWKIARVLSLGGGNEAIWKHSFIFSVLASSGDTQREVFVKTGDFRIQDAHRKINGLLGLPAYKGITCVRTGGRSFEVAERIEGPEGYKAKGKIPAGTENEVFKSLGRHAFYNLSFSVGDTHRRNDLIREDGSIARIDTEVSLQPNLLQSEKAILSNPIFEKFISENLSGAEALGLTREDMGRLWLLAVWINRYLTDLKENISREEYIALVDGAIKAGFTELAGGLRNQKDAILAILERAVSEEIPTYPRKAPLAEAEIAKVNRWTSLTDIEVSGVFGLLRKALLQISGRENFIFGSPVDIHRGVRAIDVTFRRQGRFARGFAVIMDPKALDFDVWISEGVRGYDFFQFAIVEELAAKLKKTPKPFGELDKPPKTIAQFRQTVLSGEERERAILIGPATFGGFWTANTLVIKNGELIKKNVPGIYQETTAPLNGTYYFFILDVGKTGIRIIHLKDGNAAEDISDIKLAIAGPPLRQDNQDISNRLKLARPQLDGVDLTYPPDELTTSFTALGCDNEGNLIYLALAGEPNKQPEIRIREVAEVAAFLGVKDAIQLGGGVDVQVDLKGREILIAKPDSHSDTARWFPDGRPVATIFTALAKRQASAGFFDVGGIIGGFLGSVRDRFSERKYIRLAQKAGFDEGKEEFNLAVQLGIRMRYYSDDIVLRRLRMIKGMTRTEAERTLLLKLCTRIAEGRFVSPWMSFDYGLPAIKNIMKGPLNSEKTFLEYVAEAKAICESERDGFGRNSPKYWEYQTAVWGLQGIISTLSSPAGHNQYKAIAQAI